MSKFNSDVVIGGFLLLLLVIVGLFDFVVGVTHKEGRTVSKFIMDVSIKWPIVPFIAGLVIGHLFFPQTRYWRDTADQ